MQTLSFGFLKPEPDDTGDIFFSAMEQNMQQLNDHDHDGVNSARLALTSASILAANWVAAPLGGGLYRQLITMPAGMQYDTSVITFKLSTGEVLYPTVERVNATQYYVYVNDNTLDLVAYYR